MSKRKQYHRLLSGEHAASALPFPLTHEQRDQQKALHEADRLRSEIKEMLMVELQQLINGLSFEMDIVRCQGSAMDTWLNECSPLMMRMDLAEVERDAYMAMDHLAIHQLADLCLGGRMRATKNVDISELTVTETRIALRVFQRVVRGLEYLFQGSRSGGVAEVMKQVTLPASHSAIIYKVRMLLDGDVISWFIWLPVAMVIPPSFSSLPYGEPTPVMDEDDWLAYPIKGRAVLLEKQINVKQLQQLLAGQFMPLSLQDDAHFRIGKRAMFSGKVAQEDGKLVFQVTQK
ncbi:hypothetical protein HR45_06690 [Shewanella mangrovi]|uniref:Flagellar motor switch protein FliN-like C-terminal domain-containing protein n=1 Tax=Shewanella mangrovi TaxID=1515746 RepID=A0A094K0H7_9GAMM|nr:FliM/FliN family flagellar motor switch protein [Shewanella mangrovi]KFZ38181.1 hypothetical protein HR45_06690 [Shewanella mangrovi]